MRKVMGSSCGWRGPSPLMGARWVLMVLGCTVRVREAAGGSWLSSGE